MRRLFKWFLGLFMVTPGAYDSIDETELTGMTYDPSEDEEKILMGEVESYFD